MTEAIKRRRGTDIEHSSFVGLEGELTVNTTTKRVHVHDGVTSGGFPAARLDEIEALDGDDAWLPIFALEAYGVGHVLKVADWQSGTGTPPPAPVYLTITGYDPDISNAVVIGTSAAIAFRAARAGGANQTGMAAGSYTKAAFNSESLDSSGYYDASINYRFTPLVSGWYEVFFQLASSTGTSGETCQATLRKNGSMVNGGTYLAVTGAANFKSVAQDLIYLNGSTDYVEAWAYLPAGVTTMNGDPNGTYFYAKRVA